MDPTTLLRALLLVVAGSLAAVGTALIVDAGSWLPPGKAIGLFVLAGFVLWAYRILR